MSVNIKTSDGLVRIAGNGGGIANSAKKWENPININGMIVDGSGNRVNYFEDKADRSSNYIFLNATLNVFTAIPGALVSVKIENGRNLMNETPFICIEPWCSTRIEIRCNGGGECNCMIAGSGEIMTFLYTGEYFEHISGGFVGKIFDLSFTIPVINPHTLMRLDSNGYEGDYGRYEVKKTTMSWGVNANVSYWLDEGKINPFIPSTGISILAYIFNSGGINPINPHITVYAIPNVFYN